MTLLGWSTYGIWTGDMDGNRQSINYNRFYFATPLSIAHLLDHFLHTFHCQFCLAVKIKVSFLRHNSFIHSFILLCSPRVTQQHGLHFYMIVLLS